METSKYFVNHNQVTISHDKSYNIHILYLDLDQSDFSFDTLAELVQWVANNNDIFDLYKDITSVSDISKLIEDTYPEENIETQAEYVLKAAKLFNQSENN